MIARILARFRRTPAAPAPTVAYLAELDRARNYHQSNQFGR